MSQGTELWNEAKRLIPGGNQLLSKRAEMFLPDRWPSYFKKASGVEVWDLDDRHYIDMSIMGIGTCILGYAHPRVNAAVIKAVTDGNMCTLNCYEEVLLARKLVELHPWAGMVRFARTGGEACAVAVRIARAHSGRDKVAFCGYHGWCDWYLASNLADEKNLDGQLLPGLKPAGVPRGLQNTALPFHYGRIDELKALVHNNPGEIGVIMTEVCRHDPVNLEFLREVQAIARDINAVLIFDEVSSGFRITTGGMQRVYGLDPDLLVLGKALGNGYPISAVIGRTEVMQAAQETFISSTYWTERVGFAAALETIQVFEDNDLGKVLQDTGAYLSDGLEKIFKKHGLNIALAGMPSVPCLVIRTPEALTVKTVLTQEMLKKGYLAGNVIYLSAAHTQRVIDRYLEAAEEVWGRIAPALQQGTLSDLLEGPVCHSGFKRLV